MIRRARRIWRGVTLALAIAVVVLLAGRADGLKMAAGALGGGPYVAANVQAGKTNAQVIGGAAFTDQHLIKPRARTIEQAAGETGVRAEAVQSVTVQNEAPAWIWALMIAGWLLPSPSEIGSALSRLVTRRKKQHAY